MRESLPSLHRLVVYNINAVADGRIACELKAARVLFLTDIAGVLDKNMELLKSLTCDDIDGLIEDETITGGCKCATRQINRYVSMKRVDVYHN